MKKKTIIIAFSALAILLLMTKKAFAKPTSTNIIRGNDSFGSGAFGATRGDHIHQGEDYVVKKGESVFSPITGKVTRFPIPYAADTKYKGIEIKNSDYSIKIFYMLPSVAIGTEIKAGDKIGIAQNIAEKYGNGMTPHIHVEIRDSNGKLLKISDFL